MTLSRLGRYICGVLDIDVQIKGRQEQVVEARFGLELPLLLSQLYERGLTQQDIAIELGVHRATIVRWMKRYGTRPRDRRALAAGTAA